jgi:hypothetical protein
VATHTELPVHQSFEGGDGLSVLNPTVGARR